MGTIDWLVFQTWFFPNEDFFTVCFLYIDLGCSRRDPQEGGTVTQVISGGRRVPFEDTAGAAMMPSVSSWLAQFVYAVWRAPERAMRPTSQCWGETDGQDYGQDAVYRVP